MSESERVRVTHPEGGRVITKQSDAGNADINVIVRRARQEGFLPPGAATPRYGDFTSLGTFHEHQNRVLEAEEQFMAVPAAVRQACGNDVGRFLEKVFDDEGRKELLELGLDPERVPAAARPVPPEPVPEPQPEPGAEPA